MLKTSEHIDILEEGVSVWNDWRKDNPSVHPLLQGASLNRADLRHADLSGSDLSAADLITANLYRTDLSGAILSQAKFVNANLVEANLRGANLISADLRSTDLLKADLQAANLSYARLRKAYLDSTDLRNALLDFADLTWARFYKTVLGDTSLTGSRFGNTILAGLNLSSVRGLEEAKHDGPSSIGVDTIILSAGRIPSVFLKACGIKPSIQDLLVPNSRKPRQSCFISYSSEDSEFASLLQSELNKHNVPYWYAPEHAVWGKELHSQLRQAIAEKDRVIFICSKASLSNSDWVQYELVGTFEEEERRRKDGREDWRMAFLIMLDDFLNSWDHYLKPRLTQVLAGDFRSARRRGERFQRAVARLLEGLALPQQD